jgi:hypothetical protein
VNTLLEIAEVAKKRAEAERGAAPKVSKKDQVLSLYRSGITDVTDLAAITVTRPSYVASVLHEAEGLPSYFDLYTSTSQPMNIYSKHFAGKLGFRDETSARESVEVIDNLYRQFELVGDRAGQHHALLMALTMFDRARWIGKDAEAEVFRAWLRDRLDEAAPPVRVEVPTDKPPKKPRAPKGG